MVSGLSKRDIRCRPRVAPSQDSTTTLLPSVVDKRTTTRVPSTTSPAPTHSRQLQLTVVRPLHRVVSVFISTFNLTMLHVHDLDVVTTLLIMFFLSVAPLVFERFSILGLVFLTNAIHLSMIPPLSVLIQVVLPHPPAQVMHLPTLGRPKLSTRLRPLPPRPLIPSRPSSPPDRRTRLPPTTLMLRPLGSKMPLPTMPRPRPRPLPSRRSMSRPLPTRLP